MRIHRGTAALVLLALYAAASDARWAYRAVEGMVDARGEDSVSQYEDRFRDLAPLLPRRGVVGYTKGPPNGAFTTEDFRRFLLTQYALAPHIVVNDTVTDATVANFLPDSVPSQPPPGLQIVWRSADGGVWLMRPAR